MNQPESEQPLRLSRRKFLVSSLALAALSPCSLPGAAVGSNEKFRAGIIGHTGHGNYGHDHDIIFNGRSNVEVVAVADPDSAGRAKATQRTHALRSYSDYRAMLEKEKPDLVCIAPRCTDEHHAMAMGALSVGSHLYIEKPITETLAQADRVLAEAARLNRRVAVPHQMRLAPNVLALKKALDRGLIGELLEVRAHGKQDRRAGGEDLIVLGVHLFDLMRFFAGDPSWCSARVLQSGHEITRADAHPATESVGPVAGDDISAEFAFPGGVRGSFVSRAANREVAGPWGLQFIGSKGTVKVLTEMIPTICTLEAEPWSAAGKTDRWRRWDQDPTLNWSEGERGFPGANARVVDDWLAAISEKREPICSGSAAAKALEMAMAVFAAGLGRGRVEIPLRDRRHPLAAS